MPQQVHLLRLIAPTAVLPERYPVLMGPPDQIAKLLYAHPEHPPAHLRVDPAKISTEMTLVHRIGGASRDTKLEEKLT